MTIQSIFLLVICLFCFRYEEASKNIKEEIQMFTEIPSKVGRLTSGLVLVQFQRGDTIEADKCYQASFRYLFVN